MNAYAPLTHAQRSLPISRRTVVRADRRAACAEVHWLMTRAASEV